MNGKYLNVLGAMFLMLIINSTGLFAQEKHEHDENAKHEHGEKAKHEELAGEGHAAEGHAGHMQRAGYSKEQREKFNHMHHQLDDDQKPYKEKEALALKELNEMTIREDVNLREVNAKIDELMAAKKQIMRIRYEHLIEMRRDLTDKQKVRYDERVLQRTEVK